MLTTYSRASSTFSKQIWNSKSIRFVPRTIYTNGKVNVSINYSIPLFCHLKWWSNANNQFLPLVCRKAANLFFLHSTAFLFSFQALSKLPYFLLNPTLWYIISCSVNDGLCWFTLITLFSDMAMAQWGSDAICGTFTTKKKKWWWLTLASWHFPICMLSHYFFSFVKMFPTCGAHFLPHPPYLASICQFSVSGLDSCGRSLLLAVSHPWAKYRNREEGGWVWPERGLVCFCLCQSLKWIWIHHSLTHVDHKRQYECVSVL